MSKVLFEYEGQVSSGGLNSWDRDSNKRVTIELNDDDLTVDEMLNEFMNFMQAIGYSFELGDRFEVVNDFKQTELKTPTPSQPTVEEYKIDFSKYDPIVDESGTVIGTAEKKQGPSEAELDAEVVRLKSITFGLSEEAYEMIAYRNLSQKEAV